MHTTDSAQSSGDIVLKILKIPSISFMVGPVPMVVDTTVPVHAGFTSRASYPGLVHAKADTQSQVTYGISYSQSNGFQFLHDHKARHNGALRSVNTSMQMTASLYLLPTLGELGF